MLVIYQLDDFWSKLNMTTGSNNLRFEPVVYYSNFQFATMGRIFAKDYSY